MLDGFYIDENFWKSHPDLNLGAFAKLQKNDKSKDKKQSSLVMWAIALIWDLDSKYAKIEEKDRIKLISKEVLNNETFFTDTPEKYTEVIEFYKYIQRDAPKRVLESFDKDLDERREFMESMVYDESTWEQKDKMWLATQKLMEQREKLVAMVSRTQETKIKGGKQLGLLETQEL